MSRKYIQSILVIAATFLSIVACATGETQSDDLQVYNFPARDEFVCRRQRTVGSHVPKTVCRTRGQMEADQREALEAVGPLRTMSGNLPTPPPPPPPPN